MPDYADNLDLLAPADALKAYLDNVEAMTEEGAAWMADIEKVVDRQHDMEAAMAIAVAKATGIGVFISLDGWDDVPPDNGSPLLPLVHSISLWSKPEKNKSHIPESVALGALAQLIHGWIPDDSSSINCQYRWRIGSAAFVKSKGFRIYEFPAIFEVAL